MKIHINRLLPIIILAVSVPAWGQESKLESSSAASGAKASQSEPNAATQAPDAQAVVVSPAANTNGYNPSTDPDEAVACKKNLEKINTAIEAYRKDNHDDPNW